MKKNQQYLNVVTTAVGTAVMSGQLNPQIVQDIKNCEKVMPTKTKTIIQKLCGSSYTCRPVNCRRLTRSWKSRKTLWER